MKREVSFRPQPFYTRGKSPGNPLYRKLDQHCGLCGKKEKKLDPAENSIPVHWSSSYTGLAIQKNIAHSWS
jgi:hypothetical protein